MSDDGYNNRSNDPSQWTSDKQWAEAAKGSGRPYSGGGGGSGPMTVFGAAGVAALLGFVFGMFFSQGSWAGGVVGAIVLGLAVFVIGVAFRKSSGGRDTGKLAAIGAVIGFIAPFITGALFDLHFPLFWSAVAGAIIGVVISRFR